ncbi:MAG TPA: hypothetical protein VH062_07750 [Polyangiaceae bacterium]|nr:hypothetical protein [Polyangiaceae bacterium]
MTTPRQPISRVSKSMIAFVMLLVVPFGIFAVSRSYYMALAALVIFAIGYAIYFLGMSSGLPGTSGRNGRNVRT